MTVDPRMSYEELTELEDALADVLRGRALEEKHGLADLDDMALTDKLLGVVEEIERRNTEDEAAALAEYWKEAFV